MKTTFARTTMYCAPSNLYNFEGLEKSAFGNGESDEANSRQTKCFQRLRHANHESKWLPLPPLSHPFPVFLNGRGHLLWLF